ncbi:MAG: sulfite exporter TauE/SafE family protein [Cytophagales bacterium]|nr:sulfite exporter TauE/SafE family protein [Cytophagales bacterium]
MNIIPDPWFYAAAIPSAILMGLGKSGFGAGLGALAVPLMALTISVPQAAAIMMPLLLLADVIGLRVFRREFDLTLLRQMLPFGLFGIVLGTILFKLLAPHVVAGCVGAFTLLFLAQRFLFPPKADAAPPPRWLGATLITLSGFTSFISHAGSPPFNAYAIPLKLKPVVFVATASYFFFFINMAKWLPYAYLGLLDMRNFWTSLVLMPFATLGVWLGQYVTRKMNPALFYRLVYVGMFLSGTKLLWDAF